MKEKTDKDDTNKFIYIKNIKKNNNKEKTAAAIMLDTTQAVGV